MALVYRLSDLPGSVTSGSDHSATPVACQRDGQLPPLRDDVIIIVNWLSLSMLPRLL